jgi:predicted Na+-dependent transporter
MFSSFIRSLRRFTESPVMNLLVGVILFATGLSETIDAFEEEIKNLSLGAHHGAAVFGLFHILRCLPDLLEGLDFVQVDEE